MAINSWHGIGNLGKDPELRYASSGKAVANFSIAINDKYNGQDRTEWVNIVAWGKTAENVAQFCKKGSPVYVEGRLQTSSYDDRDGNKRYKTEVVANRVQFLGAKGQDADRANDQAQSGQPEFDEVPF